MIGLGPDPGRSRPRALVVGPLPPPAHGCSLFTRHLLQSRFAAEFDVVHADITDPRSVHNIGRFDAGNVWYAVRHGTNFGRLLVASRPDVVYIPVAQNTLGFVRDALFLTPAALSGRPYVIHFHGDAFGAFRAGLRAPLRAGVDRLLRGAAAAVVQSPALAGMLHGAVPAERIRIVPNGVPDIGAPRSRPLTARPVVAWLAQLRPEKGLFEFVRAATDLLRAGVAADFVLAGDTGDRRALEAARRMSADYAAHIHFPGVLDDGAKTALLQRAEVFCLPSHSEAHPLAVLEAMSAGLPVVSTTCGAIPDTVVAGTGLLVPPGDADGLRVALGRLLADAALRSEMGTQARRRYLQEYTMERWVDRMLEIFRPLVPREAVA